MKKIPFLIAFFSISIHSSASGALENCVSASTAGSIRYDVGSTAVSLADDSLPSLYFSASNHFFVQELSHARADAILPTRFFTIGCGTEYFGYNLYNQLRIRSSFTKIFQRHWSGGFALHLRRLRYEGQSDKNVQLSCDLFVRLLCSSQLEFYCKGENLFLTHASKFVSGEERNVTAGSFFKFSDNASCATEVNWRQGEGFLARFGMVYTHAGFSLRCGVSGPPITPAFGCGFKHRFFRIDIAARWIREMGYILDCGIGFQFKTPHS